jgi:uncharacterized protein with PIN domain
MRKIQFEDKDTIVCSDCNNDLPKESFSDRPDREGHKYTICKKCKADKERERRWRKLNKNMRYLNDKDIKNAYVFEEHNWFFFNRQKIS